MAIGLAEECPYDVDEVGHAGTGAVVQVCDIYLFWYCKPFDQCKEKKKKKRGCRKIKNIFVIYRNLRERT